MEEANKTVLVTAERHKQLRVIAAQLGCKVHQALERVAGQAIDAEYLRHTAPAVKPSKAVAKS